eukprot:UN25962
MQRFKYIQGCIQGKYNLNNYWFTIENTKKVPKDVFATGLKNKKLKSPNRRAKGVKSWYRVCLKSIVRKDKSLKSAYCFDLEVGTNVEVDEIVGRRARIIAPVQ